MHSIGPGEVRDNRETKQASVDTQHRFRVTESSSRIDSTDRGIFPMLTGVSQNSGASLQHAPGDKQSAAAKRNLIRLHGRNNDDIDLFGKYMPDDLSTVFDPPIHTPDDENFDPPP